MTTYELHTSDEMTDDHWQRWREIQAAAEGVDSPFFSPEFTQAVAMSRDDVEVAVIRNDSEIVGYWPMQRDGAHTHPVSGRLSEFHGVIALPDAEWSPGDLIRECKIASWRFDHLPAAQSKFSQFTWGYRGSPFMDLSAGYEAYREQTKQSGSTLSQTERKARKLEREVGPLRFEYQSSSAEVLNSLMAWKNAQYARTRRLEIFHHPWVKSLLDALQSVTSPTFTAPLSALYAGDELLAVHQGITSPNAMHIWFPAYNVEHEGYSPGAILLLKLAEAAAERGIQRIDFGPGEERYKQSFKSSDLQIAQGYVSHNHFSSAIRSAWYGAKVQIRSSPWRAYLEAPLNASRHFRQWLTFK